MAGTKIPAIPNPADIKRCLTAIKEQIEIREGRRGEQNSDGTYLDKFVSFRDLEDYILNSEIIGSAISYTVTSSVGFGTPSERTISSGAIIVTDTNYFRFHTIDTEGDAPSDDLDTITGGNAGELLLIKAESGSRTVVVKNSASIVSGTDFTMNNIADAMLLVCISSGVWYPLTKYNAGN